MAVSETRMKLRRGGSSTALVTLTALMTAVFASPNDTDQLTKKFDCWTNVNLHTHNFNSTCMHHCSTVTRTGQQSLPSCAQLSSALVFDLSCISDHSPITLVMAQGVLPKRRHQTVIFHHKTSDMVAEPGVSGRICEQIVDVQKPRVGEQVLEVPKISSQDRNLQSGADSG